MSASATTLQKQKAKPKKSAPGFELIFKNDIASAIDYICRNSDQDFGLSELSARTGISSRNVYRVIDHLIARRIVKKTREIGSARMFKYNDESHEAATLKGCYDALARPRA
jgi:AraC-like DNA-binding protein